MTARTRQATRPYGSGRVSPQRRLIAEVAEDMGGAFVVDELVEHVRRADDGVGVATVYRAVAALESTGWLERVGVRGSTALFARCRGGAHHHHLVCSSCGRVIPIACPVDARAETAAAREGFEITSHEVTLVGLCAECRERGDA